MKYLPIYILFILTLSGCINLIKKLPDFDWGYEVEYEYPEVQIQVVEPIVEITPEPTPSCIDENGLFMYLY